MKPTEAELEMAIVAAERMFETGSDDHHLAKSLLYLYQRLQKVERVRQAAENYLHSGLEESRHAELSRAIEAARKTEAQLTGEIPEDRGLT
jgi:hypothetical protein